MAGAEDCRQALAAFLRSRRERIDPRDVGLPPGIRRRTPGLRREEVAQLAGIGLTWYTWLEQGRRINASLQVLGAVARALRLDPAEAEHLYQLAGADVLPPAADEQPLEPELQEVLDALSPNPATILNARSDLRAWNQPFAALFPRAAMAPAGLRNLLWLAFTAPACCHPFADRTTELTRMAASFRARSRNHLDEPAWTGLVEALNAASPDFAEIWEDSAGDQAPLEVRPPIKTFRLPGLGTLTVRMSQYEIVAHPGSRLTVYTPVGAEDRSRLEGLVGGVGVGAPHCKHVF